MEKFKKVLEELTAVFVELASIAQVKLESVTSGRVATLEECMSKEQAISMKLRGLDLRREATQQELSFDNLSFSKILERLSEEERMEIVPIFDGLSRSIQLYREINEDVTELIKLKRRMIDKSLNKQGFIYESDGENSNLDGQLTDTTV